jgi:hypothetical protein
MENIQSNIQGDNMETQSTIQQLFQEFINGGGEPKVTSFKRHLDQLINSDIKHLCGRSAKSSRPLPDVVNWRSEVKDRFSGRGAKWVKVSIDEVLPTLENFDDVTDYMGWIQSAGFAWIRFAGPRVANGSNCAAFEVRTGGSTIDHPKQLHYIAVHELDDKIEALNSTPHAMKLEVAMTRNVDDEAPVGGSAVPTHNLDKVVEVPEADAFFEVADDDYEDAMGSIEELMAMEDEEL